MDLKTAKRGKRRRRHTRRWNTGVPRQTDVGEERVGGVWALTLTGPIRPSQDGALLDLAKGLK